MNLSRFSEEGIEEFRGLIESWKSGSDEELNYDLLTNDRFVEDLGVKFVRPESPYPTRLEMAGEVDSVLSEARIPNDLEDIGLWAWLSAALNESVCPVGGDGTRRPGKEYRHIPTSGYRDFYRHLVRGPVRIYRIYRDNPADAGIVLCQQPSSPGDFVEQLAARQERLTSSAALGCATRLYISEQSGKPKPGESPNEHKPGTLRRYLDVLDQLELTYDLYSIGTEELYELLPPDFDRLK